MVRQSQMNNQSGSSTCVFYADTGVCGGICYLGWIYVFVGYSYSDLEVSLNTEVDEYEEL